MCHRKPSFLFHCEYADRIMRMRKHPKMAVLVWYPLCALLCPDWHSKLILPQYWWLLQRLYDPNCSSKYTMRALHIIIALNVYPAGANPIQFYNFEGLGTRDESNSNNGFISPKTWVCLFFSALIWSAQKKEKHQKRFQLRWSFWCYAS